MMSICVIYHKGVIESTYQRKTASVLNRLYLNLPNFTRKNKIQRSQNLQGYLCFSSFYIRKKKEGEENVVGSHDAKSHRKQ